MEEKILTKGSAERKLRRHISPLSAWALSIGTSIGWGSFVITSNTYLASAGPMGSAVGMLLGALVMLIIARNYHCMMQRCPDSGGVYSYVKNVFGYGDGVLIAWFLALTYFAMLWANLTSLPLFARYFFGNVLCFGKLYNLFGYDVWFGEAMISIIAMLGFGFFSIKRGRLAVRLNAALALVFTVGITVCFAAAIAGGGAKEGFEPRFVPDSSAVTQIMRIAFISPWAFVGFENISHAAEEFSFPVKRAFRVLTVSVVSTTLLYIFVTLLSVTAYPPEYANWLQYIRDLDNISGIGGLPAFYAARHYLGDTGVTILMISLLALIFTSLVGNTYALSRLFYALARDRVLPARFERLNQNDEPQNAILLIVVFSLFIPFLGRTCIGWIVDVTTVGATIVYGVISAAVFHTGRLEKKRGETLCGGAGIVIMLVFGFFLLLPNLLLGVSMEQESYFIFTLWSILGLFFFRNLLAHDLNRRFENSIHVWVALLVMIVFMGVVWMGKVFENNILATIVASRGHYTGIEEQGITAYNADPFIRQETQRLHGIVLNVEFVVLGLFAVSLAALLWNYLHLRRTTIETRRELGTARSLAYTDPLTGVKSKHAFVEAEMHMDQRIDLNAVRQFGIVIGDINGTKTVNDTRGHRAGDEYIRAGCELICSCFKFSPVYRIGGDEFAVLLEGVDYERREKLMQSLNFQMEQNIHKGGPVAALGLAVYRPGQDNTFRSVFERADSDMYKRKKELKAMGADVRE